MASEKKMAEWKKLSKADRAKLFEKAAKNHKWVYALTQQNIELYHRVKALEKEVRKLKKNQRAHEKLGHVHTFLVDYVSSGCRRCGKDATDPVHKVVDDGD